MPRCTFHGADSLRPDLGRTRRCLVAQHKEHPRIAGRWQLVEGCSDAEFGRGPRDWIIRMALHHGRRESLGCIAARAITVTEAHRVARQYSEHYELLSIEDRPIESLLYQVLLDVDPPAERRPRRPRRTTRAPDRPRRRRGR